jgi:hypothetical protein
MNDEDQFEQIDQTEAVDVSPAKVLKLKTASKQKTPKKRTKRKVEDTSKNESFYLPVSKNTRESRESRGKINIRNKTRVAPYNFALNKGVALKPINEHRHIEKLINGKLPLLRFNKTLSNAPVVLSEDSLTNDGIPTEEWTREINDDSSIQKRLTETQESEDLSYISFRFIFPRDLNDFSKKYNYKYQK